MEEDLILPERIRTIQCGFLLDEVINPNKEFYTDHRLNMGQLDPDMDDD